MAGNGLHMGNVVDSIRKHKGLIFIITFLSAVAGAIFYLAGPKKFEGKTEFLLRNPVYSDKNNLYNYDTKFLDYFASEDDVDRLMMFTESDLVQGRVIRNMNFAEVYKIDGSTRKGEQQIARKFAKNVNITRSEYKNLVLSFVDVDAERAAKTANEFVTVLDSAFTEFYKEMRHNMYQAITDKMAEEDSTITALTDTLAGMRERYGIYDIISPSRNNLMLSSVVKDNGRKELGKGVEMIQNIESLKDQIVSDRARQTTIVNQFKTGNRMDQLPMIKVVNYAKTPVSPKGIGGMYTVLVAMFLGFFFTTTLVCFKDRYFSTSGNN